MRRSKTKEGIHSLPPISRQVFSCLLESRALSRVMVTWEDKHHHSKYPPLPSFSPRFICWSWCHMVQNIPLVSWDQLPQMCPLPTSYAPPPTCRWGGVRSRKDLGSV